MALKIIQKKKNRPEIIEKLNTLEEENKKLKQIAATIQNQYLSLNEEFEKYRKRIKQQEENKKIEILTDTVKKIIPLIENLRISIENIPEDIKNHKWVEGIVLTYKNLLKILESLNIYQKDSIWQTPNELYHEPISILETKDKNMKWKIIAEHQKCYIYKNWDKEIVILPAKVIIGK